MNTGHLSGRSSLINIILTTDTGIQVELTQTITFEAATEEEKEVKDALEKLVIVDQVIAVSGVAGTLVVPPVTKE